MRKIYKTKVFLTLTLFCLCTFVINISSISAQVAWDGGGDGIHWDDPLNWNPNTEPTFGDEVTITTGSFVIIRETGELCSGVILESSSTLTIQVGANLTSVNATDGVQIKTNAVLINRGTLTIHDMTSEGIIVDDIGGRLDNYGEIIIDGDNGNSGEGMEIDEGGTFNNFTGASLTISNSDNEILCADGSVNNEGTMMLVASNTNSDGIEVDNGQIFTNTGMITIVYNNLSSGEPLDVSGIFTNAGILNIQGIPQSEAIHVNTDGDDPIPLHQLNNEFCGIINIETGLIKLEGGTSINNQGIITTEFTGTNENDGTFRNDGQIRTTDGTFAISPNPLIGNGAVGTGGSTTTPHSRCNMANIPTMSQWGLVIFGLLILNLGIFFIYRFNRVAHL